MNNFLSTFVTNIVNNNCILTITIKPTNMNKNEYIFCGDALKCDIQLKQMTLEKVANAVGINKNTLNKATNSGQITIDSLLKICNYLQIPPNVLFVQKPINTANECNNIPRDYIESKEDEIRILRKLNEIYLRQLEQLEVKTKSKRTKLV